MVHVHTLAAEIADAYATRRTLGATPSATDPGFDLHAAYAVEAELVRMRRAAGRRTVGLKVGYANKAVWRALKLETLVWAHMYDDTVRVAVNDEASLSLATLCPARIEPEIVFTLKRPLEPTDADPAAVLDAVESIALGFEVVHCIYADWKFQPADFVAAYGLHGALVVGTPLAVEPSNIPALVAALPAFGVRLLVDGQVAAEGSGKNSLRSPALCLAELGSALAGRPRAEPLAAGDRVASGGLTESQPIAPGQTWTATVNGLDLAPLTLFVTE